MNSNIRLRLFLMMVLEFVIWGAWLPLIYYYLPSLKFTPGRAVVDFERLSHLRDPGHIL